MKIKILIKIVLLKTVCLRFLRELRKPSLYLIKPYCKNRLSHKRSVLLLLLLQYKSMISMMISDRTHRVLLRLF